MTSDPKYLAEGSYGCVHNPSLLCDDSPNMVYKGKVSKILENIEKEQELTEYKLIAKADKASNFYLGKPQACKTAKVVTNIRAIKECKTLGKKILSDFNDYSLIIMKDGGLNLQQYGDKMEKVPITSITCNMAEKFWLESHRLLVGIKVFLKNDIVHYDLKAQNVVYNESENRINFIDFGLMKKIKTAMRRCKKNEVFELNHWSYPFESGMINQKSYKRIQKMSPSQKRNYTIDFTNKSKDWYYAYRDELNGQFRANQFIEYMDFILYDMNNMSYENFLDNYFKTMDIYGLGLGFLYVLDKTKRLLDPSLANNLRNIFLYMTDTNPKNRIQINELLNLFENSMSIVAAKHDIKFIDNKAVKLSVEQLNIENQIQKVIVKRTATKKKISKEKLNIIYNEDPSQNVRICPEGKYLNLKTGRCNKVVEKKDCPIGKIRNPKTGRCITMKKHHSKKNKVCMPGKEINPKTGRCIKTKKNKVCPPGKEINPKTGRCITTKKVKN